MSTRKHLSMDGLIKTLRSCIQAEKFTGCEKSPISWSDCILSAFSIFHLKYPSLLQYNQRINDEDDPLRRNLKRLYGIDNPPSDTCMRERLDQLSPKQFRRPFKKIFANLQRGKMLEPYRYLDGHHIISIDGTGQYSSEKVHCKQCCKKEHRSGKTSYYHQMLGAALVHPDIKTVIPLAPEPITKQDGNTKNDCERNASKRLLKDLRREHPHLKILVVEDALASNQPHLSLLDSLNMKYVIGIKPVGHAYLFAQTEKMASNTVTITDDQDIVHQMKYTNNVPLNEQHQDFLVNVIHYTQTKPNGKQQHFSWVTNITITDDNAYDLMRAGRSRWRIENETFNTLKNQGYNFEHNYGHGKENLCSVFTMLMLLGFLIDQVQQLCCQHYQRARTKERVLYALFERIRSFVCIVPWSSWTELYDSIVTPKFFSSG